LEPEDNVRVLRKTEETIKELHALAISLTGLANVGMTVPENGAVIVPHGSRVVSYEGVKVDIDIGQVRSVDRDEVCAGYATIIPRTK
jgi:hypothetical protein